MKFFEPQLGFKNLYACKTTSRQDNPTTKKIILFMSFILVLLVPGTVQAQERTLNPEVLRRVIKDQPEQLKVATFYNNQLQTVDTVREEMIPIQAYRLTEIKLGENITSTNKIAMEYFNSGDDNAIVSSEVESEEITGLKKYKVIPELYLKPGKTEAEDISFYVFFTSEYPMQYDFPQQAFTGSLDFILLPEQKVPSNPSSIGSILVEVASRDIEMIRPERINIDHLSLPSSEISLHAKSLKDSAMIKIRTRLNPDGYLSYVDVVSPLFINAQKNTLQGFGIQEVPLTVTLKGKGASVKVDIHFRFEKGQGSVSPEVLQLRNNESAHVMVRSEGLGVVHLAAYTTHFNSNIQELTYIFPLSFLLFTLLGGIIGAGLKFFKGRTPFSINTFLASLLMGLIAVGLWYVLGINIFEFSLPEIYNEASVFFISALAAWGIGLLKK